jgi:threonine synthase
MFSYFDHLDCSACERTYAPTTLINLCVCGAPLLARYRLAEAAEALDRARLVGQTLWRYHAMLPVQSPAGVVTLGEGMTPLLRADRLGQRLGLKHLYIKDEALNPTGSFKARGLALAIARAAELGVTQVAIPSAGNAGSATAAYAARAGLQAHVFMPRDVPRAFIIECQVNGARVELVEGLITDAGKRVAAGRETHGWFDLSTLKEPYRLEGKKTMGYELAEQCDWELPHVIVSMRWKAWGGLTRIGHAWSRCRLKAVRPSCGRFTVGQRGRSPGNTPPPSPPGCASPVPWGTRSCYERCATARARRWR